MTEPTQNLASAEVKAAPTVDQAVAQGGAYEVLRKRLTAQGAQLRTLAEELNARRLAEFGDSHMSLLGRLRIRTENNSLGRDLVQVGGANGDSLLLFGFNVFMGLKTQTRVEDVFGLYRLVEVGGSYDVQPVALGGTFLDDAAFVRDFGELYAYYKDARLLEVDVTGDKLLAAFQIGERSSDQRVFRWSLSSAGGVTYLDARGERDLVRPAPFDFEWTKAGRDLEVSGRFPHLNILDTLFVETNNGDLTVKIENNTETGRGIYSESVEDRTQSLDDARFEFARVGSLILLRVLPYREKTWRGLIYNTLTRRVVRNDAITQACVQLPEDHGLIFAGGYYLQNGDHKAFDATMQGMQFKRAVRSPNGEDVLYVFYEPESGVSALFVYNMIRRELQNPIFAHGYAQLPDGRMVLFQAEGQEATRVHPMQVWQTPFSSAEYDAARPPSTTFMGKLGNAELVRGLSSLFSLAREIDNGDVSARRYSFLTDQTRRLFDQYHWFSDAQTGGLSALLHEIAATGETVLDEFEKVESIRAQSERAMQEAVTEQRRLLGRLQPESWHSVQDFVDALNALTAQRGKLLSLRESRYIDVRAIDTMSGELQEAHAQIGAATGQFLATEQAFKPLTEQLGALEAQAGAAGNTAQLAEVLSGMGQLATDLDMLSALVAGLPVDDPEQRTRVLEALSGLYSRLNQARARAEGQRKQVGSAEAVAQFAAQFGLFGQAVTGALSRATTPENADEGLARLLVQLEELEGQFGEHEEFLADILSKREELLDAFGAHKQTLLDDRQRRAQAVMDAASRILDGLSKRAQRLDTLDALNAFFAGDPLILKLRDLVGRLRDLKDTVRADDLEARLKATRDQAVRILRDRTDLFEEGGNVIKLGLRHRFSVNTQPLDLTLLPRGDHLALHLSGTDFMQPLDNPVLDELRAFWPITLESESPELSRAEYLAGEVLHAAQEGRDGLDMAALTKLLPHLDELSRRVQDFAAPRYKEGYEKGIHDHDAALILQGWLPMLEQAGPLIYPPAARAEALLYWAAHAERQSYWRGRLGSAWAMQRLFGQTGALEEAKRELGAEIAAGEGSSAAYLAAELAQPDSNFAFTRYAAELVQELERRLKAANIDLGQALADLENDLAGQFALLLHWLSALSAAPEWADHARYAPEAAALRLLGDQLPHHIQDVTLQARVEGLLSEHPRIQGGSLTFAADDLSARLHTHRSVFIPAFLRYQAARQAVMAQERERLRLEEFQARPLTSFVRNRLINDIYLPIIGDNLAGQIGTVGEEKRSDLMGLLMLISPPGYGKTTLMEYVAHRLGLVFMKINGPALGYGVRSLDPAQAPDATSRQELEKLNLALEMGNNVMLYIDDIQHTHPEFLQKFISLTDGTRRIEGVWQGKTKTYDLRGRKFAVVMAGNPYTESGAVFKIPDMLANRADIYNLGDVLGGVQDTFLLSYLENSLTSNPVLAGLATRDLSDLYVLLDRAAGKDISAVALSYPYSPAEVAEMTATLQKLMTVRDVLFRVNAQYIASAAQADQYRTEPPFKLQGSYRNMNKLAEKVAPVMNDAELGQLIADHYQGEAQLLTGGAEENLLKLGELRGTLTTQQAARWAQIKADFLRTKAMGGDDTDTGKRMVAGLADIASGLQHLERRTREPATGPASGPADLAEALRSSLEPTLAQLVGELQALEAARANAETGKFEELSAALKTSLGLIAQMAAEREALAQAQPQPHQIQAQQAQAEALRATIAPLLAGMAATSQQQDRTNRAIEELTDTIRKRQPSQRHLNLSPEALGRPSKGEAE